MPESTDLQYLIDYVDEAAHEALELSAVEIAPAYLAAAVRQGHKVVTFDTEARLPHPLRTTGTVVLETTDSLIEYVNHHRFRYDEPNEAVAYVLARHTEGPRIVVVLNDTEQTKGSYEEIDGRHQPVVVSGAPGWRDHRAVLQFTPTPGWQRWVNAHKASNLTQVEFAELVEDGLTEIAEPAGADLLEMAQTMQASTSASFRSAHRLTDGRVQFAYVEDINATAGADGTLTIPSSITLVVAPFEGAAARPVKARLRYRMNGGKLSFRIIIDDIDGVVRAALADEVTKLAAATSLPTLWTHTPPPAVVDGAVSSPSVRVQS